MARLGLGVQPHGAEVDAALAKEQIVAVGLGPPAQKGDVGFVLVDHQVALAGPAVRIQAQAVVAQYAGQDVLVGGGGLAPPDFANVLAVQLQRVVLTFDGHGGGSCILGVIGVQFADKAAHDLLDGAAEGGLDDNRLPGHQQAAVLHQPLAMFVAAGFKVEGCHCRLIPTCIRRSLRRETGTGR